MGDDKFSLDIDRFLDKAEANRHILRRDNPGWCSAFRDISTAHATIMTPDAIKANLDNLVRPVLLANCAFGFFSAAVDVGLSGQCTPCFALQRGCIESVVYAHAIMQNPALGTIWLRRDGPPEDKQNFDRKFKIGTLLDGLPETGAVPRETMWRMYKTTIGYGAHPNPNGALLGAEAGEDDERIWVSKAFFMSGLPLQLALRSTAEVGYAMVCLEDLMFGLHCAPVTLPERIGQMWQDALRQAKATQGNAPEG